MGVAQEGHGTQIKGIVQEGCVTGVRSGRGVAQSKGCGTKIKGTDITSGGVAREGRGT